MQATRPIRPSPIKSKALSSYAFLSDLSSFVGTPELSPLPAEGIHAVQSTPLKNRTGKILGVL